MEVILTFGSDQYVPTLKLKRGEKAALGRIPAVFRSRITPLLEVVERKNDRTLHQHLKSALDGLAESVKGYPRFFLDAREIDPDGPTGAAAAFSRAAATGLAFTPVTGVSRTVDLPAALDHAHHGLAIRLTRTEFENGDYPATIQSFLTDHDIPPTDIDLIIDLGAIGDMISVGVGTLTEEFMGVVPHHIGWRTMTVSACAFPRSMGAVGKHSHKLVERTDWISWKDNLHGRHGELARLPSFGDCVIQHPQGVEGFDPKTMAVSASLRYARADEWLLVKGESTRYTLPSVQFPVLATKLVHGHLKQSFFGADHCPGCELMQEAALGARGYGSAEAWRRLGTIHHISLVMQQLDALAWP